MERLDTKSDHQIQLFGNVSELQTADITSHHLFYISHKGMDALTQEGNYEWWAKALKTMDAFGRRGWMGDQTLSKLLAIISEETMPGGYVLDPSSGEGLTGLACRALGRGYTGVAPTEREALPGAYKLRYGPSKAEIKTVRSWAIFHAKNPLDRATALNWADFWAA